MNEDPIAVLMEEHQLFLRRLEAVRDGLSRWTTVGAGATAGPRAVGAFAEFLAKDVDGFHGLKEEQGLFPVLVRHVAAEGGPVGVMLEEHELLRRHQRSIAHQARKLGSDPDAVEAWRAVSADTEAVGQLLTFHIDKEDNVLFPMARAVLSPAEIAEVTEVCREIEERLGPEVVAARSAPVGPD